MISYSHRSILWFRIVNAFLRFACGREIALHLIFLIITAWDETIHQVNHLHTTSFKYKQKNFPILELPHVCRTKGTIMDKKGVSANQIVAFEEDEVFW